MPEIGNTDVSCIICFCHYYEGRFSDLGLWVCDKVFNIASRSPDFGGKNGTTKAGPVRYYSDIVGSGHRKQISDSVKYRVMCIKNRLV